ncbi:ZIP-like iron-zinc transporter [Gymnopilus junonius]|uniref:ZIP-like iron-zinc transporter n=1 Tax=Gymnopilus junonius TaxID=109634 RepID=A0A9P5NQP7_GYMJU|nr:ZIP-like iron-zinc transporter [Gymnopilus junonius]
MVVQLLIMSAVLGAGTFAVGMLPLSYAFSKNHLERLFALGTGLLLGAALGVIIPEGIETVVEASENEEVPTNRISLALIIGFILMLIIEQLISPNAHSHSLDYLPTSLPKGSAVTDISEVEFDAELGDLSQGISSLERDPTPPSTQASDASANRERAFTLLIGLVFHGCADGLALGVANLSKAAPGATSAISFVVFLALILHKAPTALAFTTSLLSTNLPRPDCKKYLAIFCLSTPLSAIVSYMAFSFFGDSNGSNNLIGTALLISGGTFLYVATVLQPVSNHSPSSGDPHPAARVFFIATGMFVPFVLSAVIGHGH